MTIIRITKRSDDYHACFDGHPGQWEHGETPESAVGRLLVLWGKEHDVLLIRDDAPVRKQEHDHD